MGGQPARRKETDLGSIVDGFGENIVVIDDFQGQKLEGKKLVDVVTDIGPTCKPDQIILEKWKKWFQKSNSPYIVIECDRKKPENGCSRKHLLIKEKTGDRKTVESGTGPAVMISTGKKHARANPNVNRY